MGTCHDWRVGRYLSYRSRSGSQVRSARCWSYELWKRIRFYRASSGRLKIHAGRSNCGPGWELLWLFRCCAESSAGSPSRHMVSHYREVIKDLERRKKPTSSTVSGSDPSRQRRHPERAQRSQHGGFSAGRNRWHSVRPAGTYCNRRLPCVPA